MDIVTKFSVRIPEELDNILDKFAKKAERSKGFIVRKALEFYLTSQEVQKIQ
jgi:predicted transcriptional regulator